jgi:hypothetical protein
LSEHSPSALDDGDVHEDIPASACRLNENIKKLRADEHICLLSALLSAITYQ